MNVLTDEGKTSGGQSARNRSYLIYLMVLMGLALIKAIWRDGRREFHGLPTTHVEINGEEAATGTGRRTVPAAGTSCTRAARTIETPSMCARAAEAAENERSLGSKPQASNEVVQAGSTRSAIQRSSAPARCVPTSR